MRVVAAVDGLELITVTVLQQVAIAAALIGESITARAAAAGVAVPITVACIFRVSLHLREATARGRHGDAVNCPGPLDNIISVHGHVLPGRHDLLPNGHGLRFLGLVDGVDGNHVHAVDEEGVDKGTKCPVRIAGHGHSYHFVAEPFKVGRVLIGDQVVLIILVGTVLSNEHGLIVDQLHLHVDMGGALVSKSLHDVEAGAAVVILEVSLELGLADPVVHQDALTAEAVAGSVSHEIAPLEVQGRAEYRGVPEAAELGRHGIVVDALVIVAIVNHSHLAAETGNGSWAIVPGPDGIEVHVDPGDCVAGHSGSREGTGEARLHRSAIVNHVDVDHVLASFDDVNEVLPDSRRQPPGRDGDHEAPGVFIFSYRPNRNGRRFGDGVKFRVSIPVIIVLVCLQRSHVARELVGRQHGLIQLWHRCGFNGQVRVAGGGLLLRLTIAAQGECDNQECGEKMFHQVFLQRQSGHSYL